jgi:hypothetical protein
VYGAETASPSTAGRTGSRRKAALDGIYVLRTTVPEQTLQTPEVVRSYKQLKEVERAFCTLKASTS